MGRKTFIASNLFSGADFTHIPCCHRTMAMVEGRFCNVMGVWYGCGSVLFHASPAGHIKPGDGCCSRGRNGGDSYRVYCSRSLDWH